MAPEGERDHPESGNDDFEGRDLLVGRPEGAEGRPAAGAAVASPTATSPQPDAHGDAIREILETVRATAARIDTLQESAGPHRETAEALARGTAALTQAVEDVRGELARAAELAARRDGQASAGAKALAEAAAALKTQGEALDKRLRETDREGDAAIQGMAEMKRAAQLLEGSLRDHTENMSGIARRLRWRPRLAALAIGAVSFVFLLLGAVLQRETGVVSLGDPRHEWNEHVAERFAPLLAACAVKARLEDKPIRCPLTIHPTRAVEIPFPPNVNLIKAPPGEDPGAER